MSDLYVKEADGLHEVVTDIGVFKGATDSADGTTGLVTKPKAGDNCKFLQGDGSWGIVPDKVIYNSSKNELQLWGNGKLISTCSFTASNIVRDTYYTITFDPNGGSGGGSMSLKGGNSLGLLANVTRSGYSLKGWYTSSSGGSVVSVSTTPSKDTTYYAQWIANDGDSSSGG